MNSQAKQDGCFLRKALLGNAVLSTLSGATLLIAHEWVGRLLGVSATSGLAILGLSLIAFAGMLVLNARSSQVKTAEAWTIVCMDVAWVLGSVVLLWVVPFRVQGKWVVAAVADLVLLFAILQVVGIRKLQRSQPFR